MRWAQLTVATLALSLPLLEASARLPTAQPTIARSPSSLTTPSLTADARTASWDQSPQAHIPFVVRSTAAAADRPGATWQQSSAHAPVHVSQRMAGAKVPVAAIVPRAGRSADDRPTTGDIIMISCFYVLIFLAIFGTLAFFYITDRLKEPEVVLLERMQTQKEVESLVENLQAQLGTLKSMPFTWSAMKPHRKHHLVSWAFVLGILVALGVLIAGLVQASVHPPTEPSAAASGHRSLLHTRGLESLIAPGAAQRSTHWAREPSLPKAVAVPPTGPYRSTARIKRRQGGSITTNQRRLQPRAEPEPKAKAGDEAPASERVLMAGTFLFFIMLNFFFMTRQHLYYQRRKALALDQTRHHVISKTVYSHYERNWQNTMQIFILVVEFVQLLSFPIQDMLKNTTIVQNVDDKSLDTLDVILALTSFFPRLSSSFYIILFWTVFTAVFVFFLAAIAIHRINNSERRRQQGKVLPIYWASYFVPIASLLYLPVLIIFVSSAQCLSKQVFLGPATASQAGQDPDRGNIFKCHAPQIQPTAYLVASLLGYIVAYVMMTTFVTSYDRTPVEGEILFKSKGMAVTKNLSLLLTIDFLLVPNDFNHLRSILSLIIIIALVCVSIKMKPCYVDQINFWRSASFCCILWTALLVTMLSNEDQDVRRLSVGGVVAAIVGGMVAVLLLFWAVRYFSRHFSPSAWVDIRESGRAPRSTPGNGPGHSSGIGGSSSSGTMVHNPPHADHTYRHYLRRPRSGSLTTDNPNDPVAKSSVCDYNLVGSEQYMEDLQLHIAHLAAHPGPSPVKPPEKSYDITFDTQLLLRGPHNASSFLRNNSSPSLYHSVPGGDDPDCPPPLHNGARSAVSDAAESGLVRARTYAVGTTVDVPGRSADLEFPTSRPHSAGRTCPAPLGAAGSRHPKWRVIQKTPTVVFRRMDGPV